MPDPHTRQREHAARTSRARRCIALSLMLAAPAIAHAQLGGPAIAPITPATPGTPTTTEPATAPRSSAEVTLRLRPPMTVLIGTIDAIDASGVRLRTSTGESVVVSLDRVASIEGTPAFDTLRAYADGLWRARTRLERGDLESAERLLDSLARGWRAEGVRPAGPTAAVLFEGQVRARLERGWTAGAVWAWLDWVGVTRQARLDGTSRWIGATFSLPTVVDEATSACVALPPIYSALLNARSLRAFADSPEWDRFDQADPVAKDLALAHRFGARFELALLVDQSAAAALTLPRMTTTHPAVELASDILQARAGGDETRREARIRLERRIGNLLLTQGRAGETPASTTSTIAADSALPGSSELAQLAPQWEEAWCRVAIGRSLLRETDIREQRMGLVAMLHVPARFGDQLPALSALVLTEVAAELERMGDAAGAARLRIELEQLGWQPIPDDAPQSPPASQTPQTPAEPPAPASPNDLPTVPAGE
jgi:hypothetical protein